MDDLRIGPTGREDELTRALRAEYARPEERGYWEALEARIMARIDREGDAWWQPFGDWVRVGLVAAAVAVVAAGLALVRSRDAEARVAYQQVVDTPRELSAQIATETTGLPDREATLRYVIAP